jgi:hypothetical protein
VALGEPDNVIEMPVAEPSGATLTALVVSPCRKPVAWTVRKTGPGPAPGNANVPSLCEVAHGNPVVPSAQTVAPDTGLEGWLVPTRPRTVPAIEPGAFGDGVSVMVT